MGKMLTKLSLTTPRLAAVLTSPWFYVLLSFYIAGSGHCLLRKWLKGLLFFVVTYGSGLIGLATLVDDKTHPMVGYCLIVLSIIGFWTSLFDAYRIPNRHLTQFGNRVESIDRGVKSIFLNLVLPGVGFFFIKKKEMGVIITTIWLASLFFIEGTYTLIEISVYTIIILITARVSFPSTYLYITVLLISTTFAITQLYTVVIDSILQDVKITRGYGKSDWPTLYDGDMVLQKPISQNDRVKLAIGELVTFAFDDRVLLRQDKYTKRIVATAGDSVQIIGGLVFVNQPMTGHAIKEESWEDFIIASNEVYVVPPFSVFVVGDNIGVSFDSRHFGPIPVHSIVSKPTKILWPLSRARLLSP